ncbi:MAG TPA: hypothetical protein VKD72_37785, partial [Gemmataceae bacterium]|nr:hypothetical protein [Gemmataceae bacterium]
PRFILDPAAIHSVYPPANETGRFDNALPHVVFTRRTLPWERTLDGKPPEWGKAFPPWLGLLLLQESELNILDASGEETGRRYEVKSLPVVSKDADSFLFPRPAQGSPAILAPDLGQNGPTDKWKAEQWQYEQASSLTLDLPAELFKAISPRVQDLPYLAHVRQIDTGAKEVLNINDKGWFSLVIGNRLPQAERAHRAFLVSLEGWQDRLNDEWIPARGQMVRLAVLGTWTFACAGSNDFKARMDALDLGPHTPRKQADSSLRDSWLHLPYRTSDDPYPNYKEKDQDPESRDPKIVVRAAYARGFTGLNHVMRQGEQTVSWYRGPLVPLNYDKPKKQQEPVSCADELLRYDPDTGLFDVTYAAAWQLGRLLALQNQSFALALDRARKAMRARAEQLMRDGELQRLYGRLGTPGADFIEDRLMKQIADGSGDKLKNSVPQ